MATKTRLKSKTPKLVDVKIAFAFAHPDPAKRYTWKGARGTSLKEAVQQLFKNQYNYWKDGEKEVLTSQFMEVAKAIDLRIIPKKIKRDVVSRLISA